MPVIESTMSPNFVFLVLGMVFCSFSELIAMTLVAALVQSFWTAKQPRLVQVAFSAAALVLSASVAYQASYLFLGKTAVNFPVALVILAGGLYLSINMVLVSTVIGLVDGKPMAQIRGICYQNMVPSFMGGIAFAGMMSGAFSRPAAWRGAIVLLPVIVLGFLYSLSRTAASALVHPPSARAEDEELVEVASGMPRPRA